ncbi:hypothetical protein ACFX19_037152 [Malus domestica]
MIYQDSNLAQRSRLYELLEELRKHNEECKRSLEVEKVLRGHGEMQKSFACMLRIKAHVTLQEQWVNEDRARFNAWLDKENFPYVSDYRSIPFEKWLGPKAGGQFSAPAVIRHRPKKIVNLAEEQRPPIFSVEAENMVGQEDKPRPPIFSVETESVVGLDEEIQVFEPQIDSENNSSKECSNDERGRDIGLAQESTPIDMIIGDKVDMEKSYSAKLFELNAEIMPGGHNTCSTHSAAENAKYFTKSEILGDDLLFGFGKCQSENFDVKRSRLGIKHRWPPPDYVSATFLFVC